MLLPREDDDLYASHDTSLGHGNALDFLVHRIRQIAELQERVHAAAVVRQVHIPESVGIAFQSLNDAYTAPNTHAPRQRAFPSAHPRPNRILPPNPPQRPSQPPPHAAPPVTR